MRSSSGSINWSQAQLDRQHTAGEVVAETIRKDRDRLAKLASQSNGNGNGHVPQEIVEAIQTATDAVDEDRELIAVTNSDPAEPELSDIKEDTQLEESYEYSQTNDY